MTARPFAILVMALVVAGSARAVAQSAYPAVRLEASIAALWSGGHEAGSRQATLTENGVGSGGRLTWFETDTTVQRAPGIRVHLGWHVTRTLALEGSFSHWAPQVGTAVSGDFEDAEALVATERLSHYVIDAGIVVHLNSLAFGRGRFLPFAKGGGGYLRQLHEGGTLIETGRTYYLGGGLKALIGSRPDRFVRAFGVRGDAGLIWLDGGFDTADQRRRLMALSIGAFVAF